jgi:hypothetical protein
VAVPIADSPDHTETVPTEPPVGTAPAESER